MAGKRYFWLKLYDDFFDSKRIKKLRRLAGGDTYLIIYLKMQLKAIKSDGVLTFTGLESDIAEEIALDINEEPDNVRVTLQYLLNCGLAETNGNSNVFLPFAVENTGSEGSSAKRMREYRERQASLCDAPVTRALRLSDGEIEKEIEIESEKDIDIGKPKKKKFIPPTLEEVKAYCEERNSSVDPNEFYEYFTVGNWIDSKGNPVRNWKQKLITWEKRDNERKPNNGNVTKPATQWNIHYDNE